MIENTFLEKTMAISELISSAADIGLFTEIYKEYENLFRDDDKQTIKAAAQSKYLTDQSVPLVDILKLIYQDENKANYEASFFILTQKKNINIEEFEKVLTFARTKDEKLNVLAFVLQKRLTSRQYDQEKINETMRRIKEIQNED
ncbi:MAG: hypothetical protein LBS84_05475 [Clostridiales bacterium]|jgi:hypothetical protein|nr:hypothetical protein [Clostridiales bacterium]